MKRLVAVAVLAILAGWAFTRPAGRVRVDAIAQKARGNRPHVSWAQLMVSMAPVSWRPGIRAGLRDIVSSLEAAAAAPRTWDARLDLTPDSEAAFALHTLFMAPTPTMRMLDVHLSILPMGASPHGIHRHEEEELIIPLSGEAEIIRPAAGDAGEETFETAAPGQIVYHASNAPHTIRATAQAEARYLVLKWRAEAAPEASGLLQSGIYEHASRQNQLAEQDRGFGSEVIFDAPTRYLKHLHAHVSRVKPGVGYPSERDPYDLVFVLLSGTISTGGRTIEAPAFVFYPADEPHDLSNPGDAPAEYLVLELHGHAELPRVE